MGTQHFRVPIFYFLAIRVLGEERGERMQNRRQTENRRSLLIMPRCEEGKAYEVGLMQNAKLKNKK
jgi:hypothetical protein